MWICQQNESILAEVRLKLNAKIYINLLQFLSFLIATFSDEIKWFLLFELIHQKWIFALTNIEGFFCYNEFRFFLSLSLLLDINIKYDEKQSF